MATRFSRDSSAELWTHLEALSREGVRWFATTAARDAEFTAPTIGMMCWTGATAAVLTQWVYNGAAWRAISGTAFLPVDVQLNAAVRPAALADLGNLSVIVKNPSPAAIWEVQADLDCEVALATAGTLDVICSAAGVVQIGELVGGALANQAGARAPLSHTWPAITGMPAGDQVIKLRAQTLGTATWQVNATHSHLVVRQVG